MENFKNLIIKNNFKLFYMINKMKNKFKNFNLKKICLYNVIGWLNVKNMIRFYILKSIYIHNPKIKFFDKNIYQMNNYYKH